VVVEAPGFQQGGVTVPVKQNARHTVGLVLVTVGGLGFFAGIGLLLAAVNALLGGEWMTGGTLFVCSIFVVAPSLFITWRGVVMRGRAIAAGSTLHLDGDTWGTPAGRTTRSGTAKPSFLKDDEERGEAT
jgi:hypothetical protein